LRESNKALQITIFGKSGIAIIGIFAIVASIPVLLGAALLDPQSIIRQVLLRLAPLVAWIFLLFSHAFFQFDLIESLLESIQRFKIILKQIKGNYPKLFAAVEGIIIVLAYLVLFGSVLAAKIDGRFSSIFATGGISVFVAIFILSFFLMRKLTNTNGFLFKTISIIIFALPLSWVWTSGNSETSFIGGLLPWSDASGYYLGAQQLLSGEKLTLFTSRRPLFSAYLSFFLWLTGKNLLLAAASMTFLVAYSVQLLVIETRKRTGNISGAFLFTLLFFFYRQYAGQFLSLQLGFPLGILSLLSFFRAADSRNWRFTLFGLSLLSLALNARAGAFVILPLLIIWGLMEIRKSISIGLPKYLILGSGAIAVGFLASWSLVQMFGPHGGGNFSNFPYVIYSLAAGNKQWTQFSQDYPEVDPEPAVVFEYAIDLIKTKPNQFFSGVHDTFDDFFALRGKNAFSILQIRDREIIGIFWLITFSGTYYLLLNQKKSFPKLFLFASIGILASIPFAPPKIAGMRAYAATIPFFSMIPAIGMQFFRDIFKNNLNNRFERSHNAHNSSALIAIGGFFIFASTIFPFSLLFVQPRIPSDNLGDCAENQVYVEYKIENGSFLSVIRDNERTTSAPFVEFSDFRTNLTKLQNYDELFVFLREIKPNQSLAYSIDFSAPLNNNRINLILFDSLDISEGYFMGCALSRGELGQTNFLEVITN
jgi:hypothetical protein